MLFKWLSGPEIRLPLQTTECIIGIHLDLDLWQFPVCFTWATWWWLWGGLELLNSRLSVCLCLFLALRSFTTAGHLMGFTCSLIRWGTRGIPYSLLWWRMDSSLLQFSTLWISWDWLPVFYSHCSSTSAARSEQRGIEGFLRVRTLKM
mgnify:CR=1 FL=1